MIFVDRKSIPFPELFHSPEIKVAKRRIEEFYERPESMRTQEKFARPFAIQIDRDILNSLRRLFNNKCAYCESLLPPISADGVVENFRPKSNARGLEKDFSRDHYWWLTYEWENLYLSCENCSRFKSSWFPVQGKRSDILVSLDVIRSEETALLIDPCFDKPEEHLVFDEEGNADFLTLKGKTTIELLKLNRTDLKNARKKVLNVLFQSCENMLWLWSKKRRDRDKIKKIALEWEDLYASTTRQPYAAIQRQHLSKWLNNRSDLQEYLTNKEYDLLENKIAIENEDVELGKAVQQFDTDLLKNKVKELIEEEIDFESLRHIYLEKIELKNYKCFSDLKINFENENSNAASENEPWLLFLGENGVGKSSVLKAITIALCGEEYFEKIDIKASNLLQHNKSEGHIKLFLKGEDEPIKVNFDKEKITSSINLPVANLIAYGAIRLLPKKNKIRSEKYKKGSIKAQNLFDYTVSLIDADDWLLKRNEADFERSALTLKDLMLLEPNSLIKRDLKKGRIYIQTKDTQINIDELSDGYQGVYSLAIDIMAAFVRDNITYDVAEGIVLIDEIGTHLHPRWKMEVVSQLRRCFPRIQFIVTTHEPLCLRGLRQGEVSVLTKDWDNKIYAITDLPDPSALRVDQLLTSPFFGLHSAVDPTIEKIFDEYYALLAKDELSDEEENRKLDLSDQIPKIKYLGDTLREELAIYVIDELLAKKTKTENVSHDIENLKQESKDRVKQIWETLKSNIETE